MFSLYYDFCHARGKQTRYYNYCLPSFPVLESPPIRVKANIQIIKFKCHYFFPVYLCLISVM